MKFFGRELLTTMVLGLIALSVMAFVMADPTGPDTVAAGAGGRRTITVTSNNTGALAGNVTPLDITQTRVTTFWQGYYGNISGTIVLGNAAGSNLYQWSEASPQGEIYATKNSTTINWTNVGCANETQVVNEDTWLGATVASTDSAKKTFSLTTHPSFQIGTKTIAGCRSQSINASGGGSAFWEALLVDNGTSGASMDDDVVVYAAVLENNVNGFDGGLHDFQMLVGEPGSGSQQYPNGNPTTYYFYVELA